MLFNIFNRSGNFSRFVEKIYQQIHFVFLFDQILFDWYLKKNHLHFLTSPFRLILNDPISHVLVLNISRQVDIFKKKEKCIKLEAL